MFASLRFRLWLTYLLVIGVVITIAAAAIFIYMLSNPAVDRDELQRLRVAARLIVQRSPVFDPGLGQAPEQLEQVVQAVDDYLQARVAIFSPEGDLLIDSRSGQEPPLPEFSLLNKQNSNVLPVFRDTYGRDWLYTTASLENGNTLIITAPRPERSVWNLFREDFLPPFLRALLLALILSLLMAMWIAGWISAPLRRLAVAVGSFTTGDFHAVKPEGPSEVQEVARSFNEMGERLQASLRSQRDFIANVSHDLKTPLTSIQGYAQAILDGATDSPSAARVIYDEAGKMYRMVLGLLDLARFDAGTFGLERAPLDLYSLLQAVVQKFALQAQRAQVVLRLDWSESGPGEPWMLVGDTDRLAQVFANLVDNGLKFTPPAGQVQIVASHQDNWAQVVVLDTGPGIPEDEIGRVFERFYQVDKARRGGDRRSVGLGLAIAREIVLAHGGTIQASNRETGVPGCQITVRLPLSQPGDESIIQPGNSAGRRTV
jgi:signal transduction histidine kinase